MKYDNNKKWIPMNFKMLMILKRPISSFTKNVRYVANDHHVEIITKKNNGFARSADLRKILMNSFDLERIHII